MGGLFSKGFNPDTDTADLKGKVVIVTGGNTGIGYSTVRFLARRGAKVYLGARNESKATGAIAALEHDGLNGGQVVWLNIDLSDPQSVKTAAEDFLGKEKRLDILVNNAALQLVPLKKTQHNISELIMTNLIGPAIFTQTLLPLLKSTAAEPGADVRIVNVSSESHRMVSEASYTVEDLNNEFKSAFMPELSRYAYSKLAFLLYSRELQARLAAEGSPILVIDLHPGVVHTPNTLPVYEKYWLGWAIKLFGATTDKGALNSVFCAASPTVRVEAAKYNGAYVMPVGKLSPISQEAQKPEARKQLWETVQKVIKDVGVEVPDV